MLARLQQTAHSHRFLVGLNRRNTFTENMPCFPPNPKFRPRERRQNAITGAVGKHAGPNRMARLRRKLPSRNGSNASRLVAIGFHLAVLYGCIQEQCQIFLIGSFTVDNTIPDCIVGLRVAVMVLQLEFFQNAGFTIPTTMCTANMHTDLTGGIAAQDRTILDQCNLGTVPCSRDCRNRSSHATADNTKIKLVCFFPHIPSLRYEATTCLPAMRLNARKIYKVIVNPHRSLHGQPLLAAASIRRQHPEPGSGFRSHGSGRPWSW